MGNPFEPKREAGESPARSRHCDRGAIPRDATGPTRARSSRSKTWEGSGERIALGMGDIPPGRPTGSQETCHGAFGRALRARRGRRYHGRASGEVPGALFVGRARCDGRDRKELLMASGRRMAGVVAAVMAATL